MKVLRPARILPPIHVEYFEQADELSVEIPPSDDSLAHLPLWWRIYLQFDVLLWG